MFTGLVKEIGAIRAVRRRAAGLQLDINGGILIPAAKQGDSISVNGVCLTVVAVTHDFFSFDAVAQTLTKTTLFEWRVGDSVNLEPALTVGDKIGGHFVSGHVDCVGVIRERRTAANRVMFRIAFPIKYRSWIVPQGSVAVDGISLTVGGIQRGCFTVYIVPHTREKTSLFQKRPGQKVNVEFDMLLKGVHTGNRANSNAVF